jgi:hypothetical protein
LTNPLKCRTLTFKCRLYILYVQYTLRVPEQSFGSAFVSSGSSQILTRIRFQGADRTRIRIQTPYNKVLVILCMNISTIYRHLHLFIIHRQTTCLHLRKNRKIREFVYKLQILDPDPLHCPSSTLRSV